MTLSSYPGPGLKHENEIRLIRLLPGSGPIECEFLVADITTPPAFEALSYTWGDSLDRREILVRTPSPTSATSVTFSKLSVTANCLAALHSLRSTKPRQLWIDAICIDQISLSERHHQLSLMGRIFSSATNVLIFLGDADEDSDLAMDYIRDLHSPDTTSSSVPEESFPINSDRLLNAVKRLFARPWFRRVWVIQEALMAHQATVICGGKTFPWAAMREVSALAANPPPRKLFEEEKPTLETRDIPFVARAKKGDFWPRVTIQKNQKLEREDEQGHQLLPFDPFDRQIVLFETLCRSRGCEATDARDKIYALLPLLSSSSRGIVAIEPNYADPAAKVFVDCVEYLLPYWGMQVLCAVQGPPATTGLPSWVPDWTVPPQRSILDGVGVAQRGSLGRRDRWGDALPWLLYPRKPVVVAGNESYKLHTRGISLGKIISLTSACDAGHLEDFPLAEWVDMSKRLVPGFKKADVYDPMAPKVFYDVVFAHEIGDGWYYYVDKDIQNTIREATEFATTGEDETTAAAQDAGWRFDKVEFKAASYGYSAMMWERCHGRRLFITDTGYLGLGPREAGPGDEVYACPSANVPFVLRSGRGDGGYQLVGECFVEERMWEGIKSMNLGPDGLEEVVLV